MNYLHEEIKTILAIYYFSKLLLLMWKSNLIHSFLITYAKFINQNISERKTAVNFIITIVKKSHT